MIVTISTSGLKRTKWWELLLRFVLSGLVTAGAGVLAKKVGPSFGGLFLAFPAILASSVTLIQKHERESKQQRHERGNSRPPSGSRGCCWSSYGQRCPNRVCGMRLEALARARTPSGNHNCHADVGGNILGSLFVWKKNFLRGLEVTSQT
jgi:uncharacterized protein DUF3147